MTTFRGITHAHTTYSDGDYTLAELRQVLIAQGYQFACMTDHAEFFDADKARAYRAECAAVSDDRFVFVPGLEYECEQKMHILGFGCTELVDTLDPQAVIRHIKARGCFSVIAHPKDTMFSWIESFTELPHAIEGWNSKYDSQYAPRPSTFGLIERLKRRAPALKATFGVDLHFRHQNRQLHLELDAERLTPEAIVQAIFAGRYAGRLGAVKLEPEAPLSAAQRGRFAIRSARYFAFRQATRTVKQQLDRFGVKIPPGLKAQLRRIF